MDRSASRRAVLATLSAAVAGCGGRDSSAATETPVATSTVTATPTPTPEPASVAVAYDSPDRAEIGRAVTIGITVENTGGRTASRTAPMYLKRPGGEWREGEPQSFEGVRPGGTATEEAGPYELSYLGEYAFRFGASRDATTVRAVPATLAWGRDYPIPDGYRVEVGEPTLRATYRYVDADGFDDRAPEDGGQWVFVPVRVLNRTGGAVTTPGPDGFVLRSGAGPHRSRPPIEPPVYRGQRYTGGRLQSGAERTGYVLYTVPDGLSLEDLRVVWTESTDDGSIAASWQSSGVPPYRGQ